MDDQSKSDATDMLELTVDVVAAYVGNNSVRATELPEIIATIHASLLKLTEPAAEQVETEAPVPPVSIKKSITDDHLISLEDGKMYKSLKRHLGGRGMTPDEYRAKWGLPKTYPMVAPGYSAQRSKLAKAAGLGRKREAAAAEAPAVAPAVAPAASPEPTKRGRSRKVKEAA